MILMWYLIAAFAEIAGCFAFWAWVRLDKWRTATEEKENYTYAIVFPSDEALSLSI